jgi:hypothetical protein
MIEIRTDPTERELLWFGLALMAFFAIVGTVVRYRFGPGTVPRALWLTGLTLGLVYYFSRRARRPIFIAWSVLTHPLGWVLTQAVLLVVFLIVLTPIGLLLRLFGNDPMERSFDSNRQSYWARRGKTTPSSRYFKQY